MKTAERGKLGVHFTDTRDGLFNQLELIQSDKICAPS